MMHSIDVLEIFKEEWVLQSHTIEEFLQRDIKGVQFMWVKIRADCTSITVISFAHTEPFLRSKSLRQRLSTRYWIPDCFWSEACQRSNGFFGCSDAFDDNKKLQRHTTWFRFLVKQIKGVNVDRHEYEWYGMNFITTWISPTSRLMVCFDTPQSLFASLAKTVSSSSRTLDTAVWSLRDTIREAELNRTAISQQESRFSLLHDFARHAIHSSETLDVARDTVTRILRQHQWFSDAGRPYTTMDLTTLHHAQQYLGFQSQMLQSLRARSMANEERLRNEIALAYNTIAQNDSKTTVRINEAVQRDSAAMKTVAILTLTFLPATYVSSVFSMSFFNFSPSSDGRHGKWFVSDSFWLYWAVSFPLTLVTIASWLSWQKRNGMM